MFAIAASLISHTELPDIDDILVENSRFNDIGIVDFDTNDRISNHRTSLKRFKGANSDSYSGASNRSDDGDGDSVLTCLQTVREDKETRVKAIYKQAWSNSLNIPKVVQQDGYGQEPDIDMMDHSELGSELTETNTTLIDSACDTWVNVRKYQQQNQPPQRL